MRIRFGSVMSFTMYCLAVTIFIAMPFSQSATAQGKAAKKPRQILFTNVNIFNGVDAKLIKNGSVLVEGNLIKKIATGPIKAKGAFTVNGEGRTLMPGLIDMHS
ncbi:MAG: amidohydrolase family protein, partial [Rhizobiaceae bacterium]